MPSPSLIDSVGHSGTHAPQAMQSSVIFMVMVITPVMNFADLRYTVGFCVSNDYRLAFGGFCNKSR
jgi:hypothetical protein